MIWNTNIYCTKCNYCLAGLAEYRCPECGHSFDPNQPNSFRTSGWGNAKKLNPGRRRGFLWISVFLAFHVFFIGAGHGIATPGLIFVYCPVLWAKGEPTEWIHQVIIGWGIIGLNLCGFLMKYRHRTWIDLVTGTAWLALWLDFFLCSEDRSATLLTAIPFLLLDVIFIFRMIHALVRSQPESAA